MCVLQATGGQSVHVPRWFSYFRWLPLRFQKSVSGEPHQYRIQASGFQSRIPADVVAILPLSGAMQKFAQYLRRLWGSS
jgi:hypothetical protein